MTRRWWCLLLLVLAGCSEAEPSADVGYVSGAEGAELFYRVLGTGRDTVVVLHGGPGAGMNTVLPMLEPLLDAYVLILFDQRGGGLSTLPSDTTLLQPVHYVEDLEAVRLHFGLEKMNVLTHSFGSVLIAEYARTYADRLKRIVLHGATGPSQQEAVRTIRARMAAAEPVDSALSARASELLRGLLAGTSEDPVADCRAYEAVSKEIALARGERVTYAGTECDAPAEAVAYYFRYTAQLAPRLYGGWDYTTGLEELEAPVLVVYGAEDSLALAEQRLWAASVPDGRLLLVPNAGKSALSDNPEFAIHAVDVFFRGEWPDGALVSTRRRIDP